MHHNGGSKFVCYLLFARLFKGFLLGELLLEFLQINTESNDVVGT